MIRAAEAAGDGPPPETRDRIRAAAAHLYVLHGYGGLNFGDIAEAVGTTRTNIHHHFGNKRRLMAELIESFAEDAIFRITHAWTVGGATFAERLDAQVADLRRFYFRFNLRRGDRNVWGPMSRLRMDLPVLGQPAAEALERVHRVYDALLRHAVTEAIAAGELSPGMPVDDMVRVMRDTLLSCGPMTQDSGSFHGVEALFAALGRIFASRG